MNATKIKSMRKQLGYTQEEFADEIGTVQQAVSSWERGERNPGRMARKLLYQTAERHDIRFIDEPEPVYSTE